MVVRHPVGGIRTHLEGLLNSVAFVDVSGKLVMPDVEQAAELIKSVDVGRYRYALTRRSSAAVAKKVARSLAHESFDLVHSHGFTACVASAMFARVLGLPHLTTAHDVFTPEQFIGAAGAAKKLAISSALRACSVIHCVTSDAGANLRHFLPSVPGHRVRVVPHGIDAEAFRNASAMDLRRELELPQESFLIGFFGRFMAQKGFRYLVDAVALLKKNCAIQRELYVICSGDDGYVREDRAYASDIGVLDQFRFLPFSPFIGPAIKAVDVVVMPSLWEASGLLAMESLCAGTPLIATTCEGLRETVSNTPAVTVPPRNSAALAAAIEHVMRNVDRQTFDAFASQAATRFSAHVSYCRIRGLYEEARGLPRSE